MARRLGGNRTNHESSSRARRCGEDGVSCLLRPSDHGCEAGDGRRYGEARKRGSRLVTRC